MRHLVYVGRVADLAHDLLSATIQMGDGSIDLNKPLVEDLYGKIIDQTIPETRGATVSAAGDTVTFLAGPPADLIAAGVKTGPHLWTAGLAAENLNTPMTARAVTATAIVYDRTVTGASAEWSFSEAVPEAIRGKTRPEVRSRALSVAPVLIDELNQIYQVSRLPLFAIDQVTVAGMPWREVPANPRSGEWLANLPAGTFKLNGLTGGGEVRCDARAPGWDTLTTAGLIRAIVTEKGGTVDEAALAVLDAKAPYLIDWATGTEAINTLSAIDIITQAVGGWWTWGPLGSIIAGVTEAPAAVADVDMTGVEILNFRLASLISAAWRIRVMHSRNWAPLSNFAGLVSEGDQQRLREEGVIAPAFEDPTIQDRDPSAIDVPLIMSLVRNETDAIAIRDRLAAAWSVPRRIYEAEVRMRAPELYKTARVDFRMVRGNFRVQSSVRSLGGGASAAQLWGTPEGVAA